MTFNNTPPVAHALSDSAKGFRGLEAPTALLVATSNYPLNDAGASGLIDGTSLSFGDIVLLTAQTDPTQNGFAIAAVDEVTLHAHSVAYSLGSLVSISVGVANGGSKWQCSQKNAISGNGFVKLPNMIAL